MSISGARLWRYGLITLGSLLGLVLLLLTTVSLALYTEAGSRRVTELVFARVNALEGIELQTSNISGNLLSGLQLTNFSVDTPAATISANSVRASWNPYSILSGSFYLSSLALTDLVVSIPEEQDPDAAPADIMALLRIQPLPVNVAIGGVDIGGLRIELPGQSIVIDQLAFSGALNGLDLEVDTLHMAAQALQIDLSLQATLQDNIPLLASVNWEYQDLLFASYDLAVGTAAITGDLATLEIQHELKAPEAIHSSGTVFSPLTPPETSLDFTHSVDTLRLPYAAAASYLFESVVLSTHWNGGALALALQSNVSGDALPALQLAAAGSLDGSTLLLDEVSVSTTTGAVRGAGQLNWSEQFQSAFEFSVSEQAPLQYLPTSLPLELSDISATGTIEVLMANDSPEIALSIDDFRGTISGYELTGEAAVSAVDDAINIQRLRLNTIANAISVEGTVHDEMHLVWQLDAPELSQLLTGITGAASGNGQIDGALDNPVITTELQLLELSAQLPDGMVFASSADLSVAGTMDQLRSSARIEGIAIQSGTTNEQIDLVLVQLQGNPAAHNFNATLQSTYGDLMLSLSGGTDDIATQSWTGTLDDVRLRSDFGNWSMQGGPVPLTLSPATIVLAETCLTLASTSVCLDAATGSNEQILVTGAVSNFPLHELNSDIGSAAMILHPALPRLPTGINLEGLVSATIDASISTNGAAPQMNFALNANGAQLSIASTESIDAAIANEMTAVTAQTYDWDTLRIDGQWVDNSWRLSGNAALSQQNVEDTNLQLNGQLNSTLTIDASGNLGGTATASFAELGWVQAFLPELTAVTGGLTGELDISGTLGAPLFAGEVALRNGSAELPRFGITLTEVQSRIAAASTGDIQLSGSVQSGDGSIAFNGDIANFYNTNRSLNATLSGSNFRLAAIEDIDLSVTPELSLSANSTLIQLNGSIDVPLLDLTLQQLPETAVDVSRDVVVVNYPESRPELARSVAGNQNMFFDIPVAADINLTLGETVAVSGFGMTATLDGDLTISQRADGRNLTYGELSIVEGNYSIYGQTLTVRQGKLLFFGAIDNPALDIRAVREAEGVTVGVLMNGTLKNIRSQLFSTPVLPDNDIIAVLVTGRPYSELGEQDGTAVLGAIASLGLDRGEGLTDQIRDTLGLDTLGINSTGNINSSTLTIGKYLTPDIFVRYGVGLFDRQSKVAIDYSLSERIMLQAESGEYQSIDLTYTVER